MFDSIIFEQIFMHIFFILNQVFILVLEKGIRSSVQDCKQLSFQLAFYFLPPSTNTNTNSRQLQSRSLSYLPNFSSPTSQKALSSKFFFVVPAQCGKRVRRGNDIDSEILTKFSASVFFPNFRQTNQTIYESLKIRFDESEL